MSAKHLPARIVALTAISAICLTVTVAAVVDDTVLDGPTRGPVPAADRIEDRLASGDWQMLLTDAVIDLATAEVTWQVSMRQAMLGHLNGAETALDQLAQASADVRTNIAEPLLHAEDQDDRTDIHEGLALIDSGITKQRAALDTQDPARYIEAGADIDKGLDILLGTYGRGRA